MTIIFDVNILTHYHSSSKSFFKNLSIFVFFFSILTIYYTNSSLTMKLFVYSKFITVYPSFSIVDFITSSETSAERVITTFFAS